MKYYRLFVLAVLCVCNDPVFGFIKIKHGLLYDIVQHPLFQRLNRINQQIGRAHV